MVVVFQRLSVVVQVEVGISQLAVDGTEDLEVLGTDLDGRLEKGDASIVVSHLAKSLSFQGELQTRGLHPASQVRPN